MVLSVLGMAYARLRRPQPAFFLRPGMMQDRRRDKNH